MRYERHVKQKTIAVSFVTVGELYFGAIKKGWSPRSMAELEQRLKAAVIVPYDLEICRTYGRLRSELKTATGTDRVVGSNDLWIASCAVRHSLPLITNNRKHFEGIPGLTIISEAAPPKTTPVTGQLFRAVDQADEVPGSGVGPAEGEARAATPNTKEEGEKK